MEDQTPEMPQEPQKPKDFQGPMGGGIVEKMTKLVNRAKDAGVFAAKTLSEKIKHKLPNNSDQKIFPPQPLEGLAASWVEKLPAPVRPFVSRYWKWIAAVLVCFLIFAMFRSCSHKKKEAAVALNDLVSQEKKTEEGPIPVKGFKVGRFNFEDSLNALGTIKGSVEFKLSFEVPGTISSINYKEGERYEEGALLISLKQDDILLRLKRAQAEMNKYQAQAQIADQKYKDHQKLLAMGAITKSAVENVKLELDSAQYETEAARLEVKAAESMLEKSNLYAPSAGMIGELNIEEGESVTANTLLGTHVNTEFVYAEFGVVERDMNKIALGQKARVFIDAYPDKTFEGVIENVSPIVAGSSRTATARVRIENPDRLLLPGMFARIRILLYSKKNTLVVPADSIQGAQGEQFVYVVHLNKAPDEKPAGETAEIKPEGEEDAAAKKAAEEAAQKEKAKKDKKNKKDGKAKQPETEKTAEKLPETVEKRAVTVGYSRPDYSQIDAGLSEGEVIAISGLERLEDGKKVRLLETQEAEV